MSEQRALIFANGPLPSLEAARALLAPGDILLAADGGTRHLLALQRVPSLVIGDLDSLPAESRQALVAAGTRFEQFPRDKNETDLELALTHALGQGYHPLVVVGGLGGRLDQTLANLALLAAPRFVGLDVRLDDGLEAAFFVRTQASLHGKPGDVVSLIPWGGEVAGVTTSGLHWPLDHETLFPTQTRGISNEMSAETAQICLSSGLLLVTQRRT